MRVHARHDRDSAVRYLRRKRRQIVQRRRRRRLMAAAAALAVALGSAVSIASFTGTDLADAAVTRARSLVDMMNERSPGARTETQLTKTKTRHAVLADSAAPVVHPPTNFVEVLAPPSAGPVPIDLGKPVAELQSMTPLLPPGIFISPPAGGGGGGGTSGGGGPPGGGSPPIVPQVPGVPEPGTWMTMLLGFGMIGWTQRRRRPALAEARS